jgi:Na+/H+ antiporter NhaD/arsenite permease-like protein
VAAVGALCCYVNSTFLFPSQRIDLLHAVDFDVLILLASIMVINHIVVHLKETKRLIEWFQRLVKNDPIRGYWVISFGAFLLSPFLTNDGVCLLFVEPILHVFEEVGHASDLNSELSQSFPLTKGDALYFLLALACSTNIGSALTYTGNPQNMIVASDALRVMPSYKFLVYMSLPSLITWIISKPSSYCRFYS